MPLAFLDLWSGIRLAPWLNGARAAAYARILLAVTLVLVAADVAVALAHGGWDANGKPLGTDFLCFWSAARLALAGSPAAAYVPAVAHALERATFAGADPGYYAFIYPPITLLICLPLGLMPYLVALPIWLAATGTAYATVIWTWLGRDRGLIPAILGFPAVLVTCGHGQNAFLTTALFGGGLLLLARGRPVLAGALFGTLALKPHLGLLIPLYLLVTGQWRAFGAAAVTVLGWGLLSVLVLGTAPWAAYADAAALARVTLEQGLVEPEKLQSVFAAVRLWNGPLALAYAAQAVAAALAAGSLVVLTWRRPDPLAGGAALVTAALMTTPYVLDYDLTLLAIPLAWLFAEGRRTGFLPWEKTVALAAYLLPLVSRIVATHTGLPPGPIVIAALLWTVARRIRQGATIRMAVSRERGAATVQAA